MNPQTPIPSGSTEPAQHPGDEVSPDTPQAAENVCPQCQGSGQRDGGPCGHCGGTGRVVVTVGDA